MWGTDHLSSVEPQGLIKLVKGIRELEEAFGDGVIQVTESEKKVKKKIDRSRPCHYDPTLTSPPFFRRSTLLDGEPLVLSKISKKK